MSDLTKIPVKNEPKPELNLREDYESRYGFHSQIIGYTIELDGNSNIIVRYINEQNYDALINPEIQFGQ